MPTPDTRREVAERIARSGLPFSVFINETEYQWTRTWIAKAIEAALKARDERAVRLIREHRDKDICRENCWTAISEAIRNEES